MHRHLPMLFVGHCAIGVGVCLQLTPFLTTYFTICLGLSTWLIGHHAWRVQRRFVTFGVTAVTLMSLFTLL